MIEKKKILIIGLKSFIGKNLYIYFKKKKLKTSICSFDNIKKDFKKLYKFDYIINCSSNLSYITKKYLEKNDHDLFISKKIKNQSNRMIFLSSRKVYKNKYNLDEKSLIQPSDNYSKNKYITEKKITNILKNRLLILRVSNIIGLPNNNQSKRKVHKTFLDIFRENILKGFILKHDKIYKDFLGLQKFAEILHHLILKNSSGDTFNVSLGKKVYLKQIISWLNYHNKKKIIIKDLNIKNYNNDSFTLNNKKLMKYIKIKNNVGELRKECIKISKYLFK